MPIYEFACPKCRKVFSFLSKRINPERAPVCPKCGFNKLVKEISRFAAPKGGGRERKDEGVEEMGMPDMNDPRIVGAMDELERDMAHVDENNPKHMAHVMRKMKDMLPPESMPKEVDIAIKRLESGEDPDKIEEDMGDVLGDFMEGEGGSGGGGAYAHDPGLYDY